MRLQRVSNGERISLTAAELAGAGGEARVYLVPPERALAAKVYYRPTEVRRRKLAVMLDNPPEDPAAGQAHISIAWPQDLLCTAYGERSFAGFLMDRVRQMRPIFQAYNPSVRRQAPGVVDYRYLHRAARNLAAAVRALHARGYVIGDVNESNILVGETALITLVDTDSFQVVDPAGGAVYRCPVGKPEYTPPELQGKRFERLDRTAEHDRFGLAVLIFQLLMEGTHPFAGLFTGAGDPPAYEARIAAGHFPFGNRSVPYRPMPIAPSLSIVDPAVRQLFLRCFEDGYAHPAARPDAQTWQNALAHAERSLAQCAANPMHTYGAHLSACPWCERTEILGGRDPFPNPEAAPARPVRRVPAASLLPSAPPAGAAGGGLASVGPGSGAGGSAHASATVPGVGPSWQHAAPLAPSAGGGALPTDSPTLFTFRLEGSGWAWGALFWALLAAASAPLGLAGLNGFMALLAVGFGVMGWRSGRRPCGPYGLPGVSRWVSALSAICACTSVALRPLTAAPQAGAGVLTAGSGAVRALSFSPDGSTLAAGTALAADASLRQGEVEVWDVASRRLVLTPERASGDVVSLAFSPDSHSLVAATDSPFGTGEVIEADVTANGAYRSVFKVRSHMRAVAWSPTGALFASAGADGLARIWDARTLQPLLSIALPGLPSALAFSPDGRRLAVGCTSTPGSVSPGYVAVWDTATGRPLWSRPAHGNGVEAVAYSPRSGELATAGNDGAVCLWEAETGRLLRRQTAHSYGIAALAFSPDGTRLASAEARQTESGAVHEVVLRDPLSGSPLRTIAAGPSAIQALAFSPRGGLLATGDRDGAIRLWRTPRN